MINIAELLKSAPKDLKLYSPICGHCKLSCILYDDGIRVIAHDVPFRFDKYGRFCSADDAECLLFPSKDCRTWEGWTPCVEPKFKVGDKISWINHDCDTQTITDIRDGSYITVDKHGVRCALKFVNQDKWELVPKPHYDISNFKPKQWVLVRQGDGCIWRIDIFSHLKEGSVCQFECVGNSMVQCIPYNDDTKHLLGTTDMCDERFINW